MTAKLTPIERLHKMDHKLAKEAHGIIDELLTEIDNMRHGHNINANVYEKAEAFVDDHEFN